MTSDQTLAVEPRRPQRRRTLLDRALAVVDAGPAWLFRSALVSLTLTSLAAILIALVVRRHGPLPGVQRQIVAAALAAICLVIVTALAALWWPAARRAAQLDRIAAPLQRSAIWLTLTCWFPALLLVAYYRAQATLPRTVRWISFGYEDKRWETAGYLLGVLAPMVALVAASRILAVGRTHPASWRAWLAGLASRPADADGTAGGVESSSAPRWVPAFATRGLLASAVFRTVAGVLTALGLAFYFYGPPWYLTRRLGAVGIGYQEDVFLAGFQAMSKGAAPYIGPAAEQYGPGAQLVSYLYMRHFATFSVVGFRESWAMFQWVGASIFFVVLFLALGYGRALIAALMSALVYPALQQIGFLPGSVYTGFFGWASPLRYAGAISLVLLLPAVIRRCPARRGLAGAAVLGVIWGGLSYLAQENLIAGAVGAVVIGVLLVLSGTSAARPVWTAMSGVLAGAVLVWIPVVVFYASKGLLARFTYLYFLMPRAVAEGYSNTPFGGFRHTTGYYGVQMPWDTIFRALPVALFVLALLAIVSFRPFRIAQRWSADRVLIVSVVLTTILLYQGAMLRADKAHLTGTMLVVPALVITVATMLPRVLGARRQITLVVAGIAVLAGSFTLLPRAAYSPTAVRSALVAPLRDRERLAATPAGPSPDSLAAARVGPGLATVRQCCQRSHVPMPRFIALMNDLHALIGSRPTYVVDFPSGYPGVIYFVADLTPAPIPLDPHTMVLTVPQWKAFLHTFRTSVVQHTRALVTSRLSAAAARIFLHRYPGSRRVVLTYRRRPYYVLLAPGGG